MNYQHARYLLGVPQPDLLPNDEGSEIAFAGRSNAGKSSMLNRLTQHKKLARVSNTPGCTQLMNVYAIGEGETHRLIDLPGYGYAKVAKNLQRQWENTIHHYLYERQSLRGVVLVMDIRRDFAREEDMLMQIMIAQDKPVHVLLSKADKLSSSQQRQSLKRAETALSDYVPYVSIQIFSSSTSLGLADLQAKMDEWLSEARSQETEDRKR